MLIAISISSASVGPIGGFLWMSTSDERRAQLAREGSNKGNKHPNVV
jgi:hypothetical protein